MTDITKLPDEWEKIEDTTDGLCGFDCAQQLRKALPTWTKITDESDINLKGLYAYKTPRDEWSIATYYFSAAKWYRPLCDLDYPPEQE